MNRDEIFDILEMLEMTPERLARRIFFAGYDLGAVHTENASIPDHLVDTEIDEAVAAVTRLLDDFLTVKEWKGGRGE